MTRYLAIVLGILGFAVLMALRDQAAGVVVRTLLAAAAGACIGATLLFSGRR
ncbi:MAG: hypothetical protein U0441_21730 [Polyangiaceae bacterium]